MIQEIFQRINKIIFPFKSERGDTNWIALLAGSAILVSVVAGMAFKADVITLARQANVKQVRLFDRELAPSDSDDVAGMGDVSGGEGESGVPGEGKLPKKKPWYKRATDWVGDKAKKAIDWAGDQIDKVSNWWKNKARPWLKELPSKVADWWKQLSGWLKGLLIGLGVAALATLIVIIICLTGGLAIPVLALIIGALASVGAGGLYGMNTDINPYLDFNFWHAVGWSALGWVSGFLGAGGLAELAPGLAKITVEIPLFGKIRIGKILTNAVARFGAQNIGTILLTNFFEGRMPTVKELSISAGVAVASGIALDTASNLIYNILSNYHKGGQWAWKFLGKIPGVGEASAWLRNHQMVSSLLQNQMVKEIISVGERIGVVPGFIGVSASLIGSMEGAKKFILEGTEQVIDMISKIAGG